MNLTPRAPRRFLQISASLLLALAVGCGQTAGGGAATEPPYELAKSDKLVVYAPGMIYTVSDTGPDGEITYSKSEPQNLFFDAAVAEYERLYPGVEVTYEIIAGDERDFFGAYARRVAAETAAGSGPDVIYIAPGVFPDIYKIMETGAFTDLSEIVKNDSDYNSGNYYKSVMDGGVYKGARYLLPLTFRLPGVIVANKAEINRAGLDLSKCADAAALFAEAARAAKNERNSPAFRQPFNSPATQYIFAFASASGVKPIDYAEKTVLPDEAGARKFFEALKAYFSDSGEDLYNVNFLMPPDYYYDGSAWLFQADVLSAFWYAAATLNAAGRGGYEAAALKTPGGGLHADVYEAAAVRAASANGQNAYDFIKVLLSDAVLASVGPGGMLGVGVNKAAAREALKRMTNVEPDAQFGAFTNEDAREYLDYLEQITDCSFIMYGTNDWQMLSEKMFSYLRGETTLDKFIESARKELSLYLSE